VTFDVVPTFVHYVPIVTTFIALSLAFALGQRYRERGGPHLLWWTIGALTYAAGTAIEASVTLFGWNEWLFRSWYIAGALLGGAPLAQGAVYLHLPRRVADILATILVAVVLAASVFVLMVPIQHDLVEPHRLTGRVMAWPWVRAFSPFINLYAFVFLVGGAIKSAVQFWRRRETRLRAEGNALIAVGALLPGIGGSFTRFGYTEVLYVTEFLGIIIIYLGFRRATRASAVTETSSHDVPFAARIR
jgi:hypothetical protein